MTPPAAAIIKQASGAATATAHPERGTTFTLSTVKNASIVLIGAAAVALPAHAIGGVTGTELTMGAWEALKKAPFYSSALSALGEDFEKITKLSEAALKDQLARLEPFRKHVLDHESNLRYIAATTKQESWMIPLIDYVTKSKIQ